MATRAKTLRQIVGALGFKIVRNTAYSSGHYMLVNEGWHSAWYEDRHGADFAGFEFNDLKSLEYNLFNAIYVIHSYTGYAKPPRTIENPYLGCKSLEEALIRKDLMDTENEKNGRL